MVAILCCIPGACISAGMNPLLLHLFYLLCIKVSLKENLCQDPGFCDMLQCSLLQMDMTKCLDAKQAKSDSSKRPFTNKSGRLCRTYWVGMATQSHTNLNGAVEISVENAYMTTPPSWPNI